MDNRVLSTIRPEFDGKRANDKNSRPLAITRGPTKYGFLVFQDNAGMRAFDFWKGRYEQE
ncbi:unnamed protein product [Dovyalis caffra]|uniref:Uncharacterized protein n=1 Tax=Dovyalis caffra TaxID=77055 RepID=A0AAV1SFB5_9ROSI|nr:unnamed protein product [Dovyalis caffra]